MVTDPRLTAGLRKMQRAYDGLRATAAIDQYNADKATLDARWQAELSPVLQDLYWHPFRNGINEAPTDGERLRQWLADRLSDAATVAILLALLTRYHLAAANLGGQTALNVLDLAGTFDLTNDAYLQTLADRATMLTSQGTEMSLIDTTIDDLATALPVARDSVAGVAVALALFITSRVTQRTVLIERYERPWGVANGLSWTFQRNGISYKMYDKNLLACKEVCEPWHGRVVVVNGPGSSIIPQHPGCDCLWQPIQYDGQLLGLPPVAVSVPGLQPWQPPATNWTGGAI